MFFKKSYHYYSDEELMSYLMQGKERAFNELYKRYGARMHNYFYRLLYQDNDLADDFTQDLFVKVIEKADSFNVQRKFSTWLYTIASNMCKNEYRRQSRNIIQQGLDNDIDIPYPNFIPEHIDKALFNEHLQTALNDLDISQKECFILRYQEELSVKEISKILDCPEGTIKSRLHYTLKKLAQKLELFRPIKKNSSHEKIG